MPPFGHHREVIDAVLDELILAQLFENVVDYFKTYQEAAPELARLLWNTKTERMKLSAFAETFFRRLGERLQQPMLLRKGEFHQLVKYVALKNIPSEVNEKLDRLFTLFSNARPMNESN
jgi:hypothetical protein